MAKYFKIIEIDEDEFINTTGEELDCNQLCVPMDGCVYVAVDNEDEEEIVVSLDMFKE